MNALNLNNFLNKYDTYQINSGLCIIFYVKVMEELSEEMCRVKIIGLSNSFIVPKSSIRPQ
jgi:hypothetical protein